MRKLSTLLLALLLCVCASVYGAHAQTADEPPVTTAQLLGTWEAEFEGYGLIAMKMSPDGTGEMYMNGEFFANFYTLAQGKILVTVEVDPVTGELGTEVTEYEFLDEDTLIAYEDGEPFELKRVEAAEADELTLDNVFLGTWEADIPSAGAVLTFEFLPNGSFLTTRGDQSFGASAYTVCDDVLATIESGQEVVVYTFVIVDENTIEVTEDGVTVTFQRK